MEKKQTVLQICVRQMFYHPEFGKEQVRQWMFETSEIDKAVERYNECYHDSYNSRTIEFVERGEPSAVPVV